MLQSFLNKFKKLHLMIPNCANILCRINYVFYLMITFHQQIIHYISEYILNIFWFDQWYAFFNLFLHDHSMVVVSLIVWGSVRHGTSWCVYTWQKGPTAYATTIVAEAFTFERNIRIDEHRYRFRVIHI